MKLVADKRGGRGMMLLVCAATCREDDQYVTDCAKVEAPP